MFISYVTSINVPTQYLFSIKIYFRPKEEMHIVFGYHRTSYIALYDVKENVKHRDVTSGACYYQAQHRAPHQQWPRCCWMLKLKLFIIIFRNAEIYTSLADNEHMLVIDKIP